MNNNKKKILVSTSDLPFDGALMKQLRLRKKYESKMLYCSLQHFSRLIGVSSRQVTRYESNHHGLSHEDSQLPTVEPLKKICLNLQVDPKKFLGLAWIDQNRIIGNTIDIEFGNKVPKRFCRHCGSLLIGDEDFE